MPSFVYKLTRKSSGKHRDTENETEIFSTLLSANRAAYLHHKGYESYYEEGEPDPVTEVNWNLPYYTSFQEDKYTTIKIKVERIKISGPDLSQGEKDEAQSRWIAKAGLDKEGGDDDDEEAESSEVEIVEAPAAKRKKLDG